ncbi:N-acetylmuramoyl-L-alanine amidase [Eubacteriales bacterium SGI.150]|uniref:N-acetylmuramoyl-L-alanine amidase n=1 Tax=Intestinimonas massiliensis (ex Afouda et al. 2020) TaxID=1673721 RepID=A0ABS9MAI1_9FIRM|nr:N-acetylmuramoyl-L-alanine amidase [Intestinimonas massiliensis (ex Afouda et al. 2020)]MCG4527786.1 N-acetylmuramoyl-L-alanine amidase [Intestinimonas massiliensis (ex Afouda et al. 2020)]
MPIIYLSPSTQENNFYVSGGTEEEWMNRLADAMVPYLDASGIQYVRNTPEMTAAAAIRASNEGNYDLHLALHSNAAPEGLYGQIRGIIVFYYPGSTEGRRAAEIVAENLKNIYPLPDRVRAEPTTAIGEVRRVRAPSVFIELGYHDNPDDAAWVKNNLNAIARNIVISLCQYFGIPFLEPRPARPAVVDVNWGSLNIRSRPSTTAPIVARAYDGARLTVINQWQGWYLVRFDGVVGYASSDYVTLV